MGRSQPIAYLFDAKPSGVNSITNLFGGSDFWERVMPAYTIKQIQSKKALELTMGYLLPVASASTTITYGEIALRLSRDLKLKRKIFPVQIGGTVGTLMERLWELDDSIPPINVLVVRGSSKKPSKGVDDFLADWFELPHGRVSDRRRDDLIESAAKDVYAYADWPEVYRRTFRIEPPSSDPAELISGSEVDGRGGFGGAAESEEHRLLKEYILSHPALVGASKNPDIANVEEMLLSGDEVDVYFLTKSQAHLVEVKSIRSDERDLLRGIYQCVKYRAVFAAQRKEKAPSTKIEVVLVTEVSPSSKITDLAKLHAITIKVVSLNQRTRLRSRGETAGVAAF
jgi:hypothetical protein